MVKIQYLKTGINCMLFNYEILYKSSLPQMFSPNAFKYCVWYMGAKLMGFSIVSGTVSLIYK